MSTERTYFDGFHGALPPTVKGGGAGREGGIGGGCVDLYLERERDQYSTVERSLPTRDYPQAAKNTQT